MMKIVRRLCDELGKTVILVLHEINYAAFYSDYICAFAEGRVAAFGTVKEVITKETLSRIYKVDAAMSDVDGRIAALADFAAGKTALVGMCTTGSFNLLGNDGRCSIIGSEIGFDNIGAEAAASSSRDNAGSSEKEGGTHGNEASFELIVKLDPDYIFVMDRDAAIGTSGAQLAREIMENELVMSTNAYQNGNLVILEHPGVWYTGEGGITALNVMLDDLENALL